MDARSRATEASRNALVPAAPGTTVEVSPPAARTLRVERPGTAPLELGVVVTGAGLVDGAGRPAGD